jgi:signal transduction histidine kinase
MQGASGVAPPAGSVRPIARAAWRGLVQVVSGSDPPPRLRWRSPRQRWLVYAMPAAVTLLLCAATVAAQLAEQASRQTSYTGRRGLSPGSGGRASSPGSAGQFSYQASHTGIGWAHLLAWVPGGLATILWVLVILGAVVPIALAIPYPLLGWRIGWLALLLVPVPLPGISWWNGLPWAPVQVLVVVVLVCAAGIRHGRPVLWWLWALTLLPWWFWVVRHGPGVVTAAVGSVAFLAMGVAVDGAASRGRSQRALADQAEQTELERARRAVLEERTRIARELHDVVAHHMSLMAVRAESAPHRLGALPDPDQVRAEFGALSGSAREALADMRRLLGVLRSDQPAERAPQPGLSDLPALIDAARQAGMAVELSSLPAPDQVPPSADVCAYRIIQEALSNAGRHAAGAPITVSVHHDADTVTLRVANGPLASAPPRANGHRPGHGLAGMRERIELLGGSLSAGPAPDGGFVVSAVLPLGGSPA